ncbi:MAG: radical SAM protein [Chromatiales bacterium]|nr:radical SAM protein [Chromatiales bacterium]
MSIETLSVPYFLQVELTYACNSHCIFCYNPTRGKRPDKDHVWNVIRAVAEAQVPLVQLTGGEVSLLRELNEYADYLADYSKVSIVTNAIRRHDLTSNISKIFLSLHGDKETHERITSNRDTYDVIVNNIEHYVGRGYEVATDVLLCSENYDQMYSLIGRAAELGMCEVFINRFQGGGFGVERMNALMPSVEQFRAALDQIIDARRDFGITVSFGTAIPLCADKRLVSEGLEFNCQMGSRFAAVAPNGDLRLCNQSLKQYGNITETPLTELWQQRSLNDYRDMRWVTGVCRDCPLLDRCGSGCRVDNSQSEDYCPDAFVRGLEKRPELVADILNESGDIRTVPEIPSSPNTGSRRIRTEKDLLIIDKYAEKYLVRSNYSALVVDQRCVDICVKSKDGVIDEVDLWRSVQQSDSIPLRDDVMGRYVDHLVAAGVLVEEA